MKPAQIPLEVPVSEVIPMLSSIMAETPQPVSEQESRGKARCRIVGIIGKIGVTRNILAVFRINFGVA
jgi:hypothetical protein